MFSIPSSTSTLLVKTSVSLLLKAVAVVVILISSHKFEKSEPAEFLNAQCHADLPVRTRAKSDARNEERGYVRSSADVDNSK